MLTQDNDSKKIILDTKQIKCSADPTDYELSNDDG